MLKLIHKDVKYKQIANDLATGKDCHVQGLGGASAAFLIAGLASDKNLTRKGEILFVTSGIEEAQEVVEDINVFLHESPLFFPVSEDSISAESLPDTNTYVQQINVYIICYQIIVNLPARLLSLRSSRSYNMSYRRKQ